MKDIVHCYVEKFKADHRNLRRMISLLLILALIVTAGVSWQLHSTGIALTNETSCGLEEHQHSKACYEKVLVCGFEEDESHTHDESCYEEQLVCGLEEHIHTIDCISDENADVETAKDWEASLPVLSGVWTDDVVAVAESQMGYTESVRNYTLSEDGETRNGYTRYGEWAGNDYGDWDAMFASFCLYYAGVSTEVVPEATGAYAWTLKLQDAGIYVEAADAVPTAGNLVFFDKDDDGKIDSVGIITGISDSNLTVIEGDSNDAVEENSYSLSSAVGYADICAAYSNCMGEEETEAGENLESATGTEEKIDVSSEFETGIEEDLDESVESEIEAEEDHTENADTDENNNSDGNTDVTSEEGEEAVTETATGTELITEVEVGTEAISKSETATESAVEDESDTNADTDTDADIASNSDTDINTDTASVQMITYTASDCGVAVTVAAPVGVLPEDAVLCVELFNEDSDAYAAAGEMVDFDAEDEGTGMAALDISFLADGIEVEPASAVTISIDASSLISDEADASTIEVQHLTETEEGIVAELVADADEGVNTETVMIEFEVGSFSTFTITWTNGTGMQQVSTSMTATTYLYGTGSTIGDGSTTLSITSGTAYDLTSSNSDLEIDGYTLVGASITYNGTTYSDVTAVTATVARQNGQGGPGGQGGNTTITYSYSYTDSSGTTTQLYSGTSSRTVTIALYYEENADISISGTGSDNEGYTLTATTEGSYTYTDYVWTIDDSSLATLTENADGTATVTWTDAASEGDMVTVTVTSTYINSSNEEVTVTDSYTLMNGTIEITIHTTYGSSSSTAAGATVALLDEDGNIVASGTTDSNGDVTFHVTSGTYYVEATYYTTSGTGQQQSSTGYSYGGSVDVTGTATETVNLTADSYTPYDHVDIRVDGSFSLTITTDDGTTSVSIDTYAYAGSDFQVTLPDGTVLSGTAEYSSAEVEYRLTGQTISSDWDNTDDYGKFSINLSVLVSLDELQEVLTDSEIEAIFGVSLADGSGDIVTYSTETNGVDPGTYIIVEVTNYHPTSNVCEGTAGRDRGYDFTVDLSSALTYLTDQLIVYKYVIDEDGNIIDDTTSFTFTLTKSDDSSVNKTTTLVSGGSDTFSDIDPGYYYITESAVNGYIPVTLDENGNIADAGYVQYVQSATKTSGTIPSVTFYNLQLDTVGVITLQKEVDDNAASGTYSDDTFTFLLYTGNETDGYTQVSSLGDITVTTSESTTFYLAEGSYTIIELGSTLEEGDYQSVSINGTELTKVVAGSSDPFGLAEGTVYYMGIIEVTAGESLVYTADNTYSMGFTLPLTGNWGVLPFVLAGLVLCLGSVFLFNRRRD